MTQEQSKTPETFPKHLSTYVALLRGINVGGNNKVEMAKLKQTFERLGFLEVKTYIASGNVVFCTDEVDQAAIAQKIEAEIEGDFHIRIRVLLRDLHSMSALVREIPDSWQNGTAMRCDVMFLLPEVDNEMVLQQLPFKPEIEDVRYIPGAVVWRIDRDKVTKSRLIKIIGTPFYQQISIRNLNTVRKLYELMVECEKRIKSST